MCCGDVVCSGGVGKSASNTTRPSVFCSRSFPLASNRKPYLPILHTYMQQKDRQRPCKKILGSWGIFNARGVQICITFVPESVLMMFPPHPFPPPSVQYLPLQCTFVQSGSGFCRTAPWDAVHAPAVSTSARKPQGGQEQCKRQRGNGGHTLTVQCALS